MSTTWIQPDDALSLWTIIVAWAAFSIWIEQRYKWAATMTGCMIALLGGMFLSNADIIPLEAPCYEYIWGYITPMAIPLLLFDADIKRIWKESGRTIVAYHFAVLGTVLGVCIATFSLKDFVPELKGIVAMLTGTYIGGSINLVAMKDVFHVSPSMVSAVIVADNFLMAAYFFVLMAIPNLPFVRRRFEVSPKPSVLRGEIDPDVESKDKIAAFWGGKEISLKDIAFSVALTLTIVAVGTKLAEVLNAASEVTWIKLFLGQRYLLITAFSVLCASCFPGFFGSIRGAKEIGVFFIHIFFVVIGIPASIDMILSKSPVLFGFASIIVVTNMIVALGLGKLAKLDLKELLISCNATIGGPTTAAAMAIAKGWDRLIVPALLVGIWGYIIGNYVAIVAANYFGAVLGLR